jgi:D-alanyl-D-alanine carboxypeptidase/D-alanyl-D-alanine-endopeptidase (penicillin-binding protein 4)
MLTGTWLLHQFEALSTSAALLLLGPAYRCETGLTFREVQSPPGILDGDVIICGGGDPALGSYTLPVTSDVVTATWINALREAGFKRIWGGWLC